MSTLQRAEIYVPEPATMGSHLTLDDIFSVHSTITDNTGVPLGSDRLPSGEGIEFEYKQCPFKSSQSRFVEGHMISGLEHERLKHSYADIRRLLLATRAGYLSLPTMASDDTLKVIDGINILSFMHYLPTYLVNRSHNPVPTQGELPRHIVVGANSASGAGGAIGAFALNRLELELPSGEVAMQAAEENGSLVGEKTVCAASPQRIASFLNILKEGSTKHEFADVTAETHGLLPPEEFQTALVFGTRVEDLYGVRERIAVLDRAHLRGLTKQLGTNGSSEIWPVMKSFHTMMSPLIEKCVSINSDLNVCLGREPNAANDEVMSLWRDNNLKLHTLEVFRGMKIAAMRS